MTESGAPVPVQHGHLRVRVPQGGGGDRQHRRDAGPGRDQHVPARDLQVRGERARRRLHLDPSPGRTSRTSQPDTAPSGTSRTPIRSALAGRGADRVRPPLLPAVDDPPQRQRLTRPERELGRRARAAPRTSRRRRRRTAGRQRDGQLPELAPGAGAGRLLACCQVSGRGHAQISLMCSNGSAQARHRYRSLHAVAPNAAVRSVWAEPHAGHGTPPASRGRQGQRNRPRRPAGVTRRPCGRPYGWRRDPGRGQLAPPGRANPLGRTTADSARS